jgi:hypothetical protein
MIKIKPDKDLCTWPLEVCCFCRKQTNFWTECPNLKPGEQLACCEKCARVANYKDVPTKEEWCNRERIVWKGAR